MSSSGNETDKASPKKLSRTRSNFKVEWLRDPDLKGKLQKNTENDDLIVVNAARSSSEMQTTLFYFDITISTNKKVHKQVYSMYSLAGFVITEGQVWYTAERLA